MAFDIYYALKITILILALLILVITFLMIYEPRWMKYKKPDKDKKQKLKSEAV